MMTKIYDFEELVAPVIKALKGAYRLKRKPLVDIKWEGPDLVQECHSLTSRRAVDSREPSLFFRGSR